MHEQLGFKESNNYMSKEITDNSMKLGCLNLFFISMGSLKWIFEAVKERHGIGTDYAVLWLKEDVNWFSPDECEALLNDDKARHVMLTFENPATSEDVHMYVSYEMLYNSLKVFIEVTGES